MVEDDYSGGVSGDDVTREGVEVERPWSWKRAMHLLVLKHHMCTTPPSGSRKVEDDDDGGDDHHRYHHNYHTTPPTSMHVKLGRIGREAQSLCHFRFSFQRVHPALGL